jgi:glycerophosphoryl diester phosphodiesterase
LDIKSPETVDQAIPVQREALERARRRGREVEILIDLGSEEIAEAYLRNPDRADAPCMCEVGLDYVRRTNARIWSPRWTLGPMSSEILQMHGEGRRVVPWTVDDPQYMDILLQTTETDGVLTDYPNMATYRYYVSH